MHFTTLAAAAGTILATTVAAEKQLQINYYSDQCKSFLKNIDVTWATPIAGKKDNCYNYQYGQFVNIAECNKGGSCQCNFFFGKDCKGGSTKLFSNGNCVGSSQLKSFACYY